MNHSRLLNPSPPDRGIVGRGVFGTGVLLLIAVLLVLLLIAGRMC